MASTSLRIALAQMMNDINIDEICACAADKGAAVILFPEMFSNAQALSGCHTCRRAGSLLAAHGGFMIGMMEAGKHITFNEMVLRLREQKSVSNAPC